MRFSKAIIAATLSSPSVVFARTLSSALDNNPKLSIFRSLLDQFGLLSLFSTYSNVTIIAPTDQAYRDLAQWGFNLSEVEPFIARALLQYHVLHGEWASDSLIEEPQVIHTHLRPPVLTNVSAGAAMKLRRNQDSVTSESGLQVVCGVEDADIKFDHGVLHTLNSSMVLPHNISITAQVNGLTKFLGLVEKAGLTNKLESLKDVTVFVPRNPTLTKLAPLLHMLAPEQLEDILAYHVIPDNVLYSSKVGQSGESFTSLNGEKVSVTKGKDGAMYVNDARVVRSDLIIYGGVAHVIEDLLVHGEETLSGQAEESKWRFSSGVGYQMPL